MTNSLKAALLLLLVAALICPAASQRKKAPSGWTVLGTVEGLNGDDWYTKKTRTCQAWVRGEDLDYIAPIVDGLDASYEANAAFMGFRAVGPLEFYFFPMSEPAHTHPKFASRLSRHTRAAGAALSGTNMCVVNLGSQQQATPYRPWEIEATCRHEMNHLFAFQRVDRPGWSWFLEAIAENIEQTVLPPTSQMKVNDYREYLRGYENKDSSWAALTDERNSDDVDSYRDFGNLLSSIVSFLQAKYGKDAIAKILRAAPGQSVDQAMQQALGRSVKDLEQEWKQFYGMK